MGHDRYTLRGNAAERLGGAWPVESVRPTLRETITLRPTFDALDACQLQDASVRDSWPTESAGAEQLDHRTKHVRLLVESGYVGDRLARFVKNARTTPVTPVCGPITLNVDYRATTCPDRLSDHVRLEREADRFLRFHDGDAQQLDTLRERTRANGVDSTWDMVVKADRAAYRGQARFIPNSHRYTGTRWCQTCEGPAHKACKAHKDAVRWSFAFTVDSTGVCEDTRATTFVTGRGYKFVGHKVSRATRITRQAEARKVARHARGLAKVGRKPVDAWKASDRTVRRHMVGAVAQTAQTLEEILWTSAPGHTYEIGKGITVTVHDAVVHVGGDVPTLRPTFPIRDGARRLALAGITVD